MNGGGNTLFMDIKSDEWYYNFVIELSNINLINGYPDGNFKPNSNVTRAEIAQIIWNLLR